MLGLGRAIGEAIAVAQVIGSFDNGISWNLFNGGDTPAAKIANEFTNATTKLEISSLFYLALILLVFSLLMNVAAQWLVLLAAPLDPRAYAAAFLLFRVFDIVKPWPIRWIERRVPGGLGIMVDDIGAAIYAVVLLLIGEGIFGVRP